MGRHLFRRKALGLLILLVGIPLSGESAADVPEEKVPEKVFASFTVRRSARRGFTPEAFSLNPPRQFHGGPAVFSPPFELNETVKRNLERILGSREESAWIDAALERSKPYAAFIRAKIEEYRLPPELFYLPVVESLYSVNAHSRSGALGLWQFMRNSALPWMKIDEWMDERKDFWKSTDAAMQKLKYNHAVTGDWLLALAAYNCGLSRVQRTVRESGIRDFWELSRRRLLPGETRAYIPRFIAVARYASHLGRIGRIPAWEEPVLWSRLSLDRPVDLRLLAAEAEIPYKELKAGNSELHFGITPPKSGSYHLKVPTNRLEKVAAALEKKDKKLLQFAIHTIASGDTLYDLGAHFGIPISLIEQYNPGIRPEVLRIGMRLLIPLYREVGPYVRKAAQNQEDSGPVFFHNEYLVKPGDTLWDIARSFGTTPGRLAKANGMMENDTLRLGTVLKVP